MMVGHTRTFVLKQISARITMNVLDLDDIEMMVSQQSSRRNRKRLNTVNP